jgi:hypothetical protein
MATFKIETSKWSWAKEVKNKDVYRDEEFVRSKTKEEALEATGFLLNKPRGLTYTITVFRDGEYFTYFRHSMPCLGGLVKYRDSHGSKYFMNPFFPRDIYVAFPEGDITFIGVYLNNAKAFASNALNEFILSKESPWVTAFGSRESIIFEKNYFVLTNMDTDPTVFYSLMRLGGMYGGIYGAGLAGKKEWNPKAQLLMSKNSLADPRRLAAQKPIRISGGTWAQGFGYTRPYNESIFKTTLPHAFKDFGKLAGYPQAPYNNEYFRNTMTKKFGVDMRKVDDKLEKALVEAWDFFKEEAKDLKDSK